jgi:hypothetical protein
MFKQKGKQQPAGLILGAIALMLRCSKQLEKSRGRTFENRHLTPEKVRHRLST